MPKMKSKPEDSRSQTQKFIDAAREHEADSSSAEADLRRAIRSIAKAPIKKPKKAGAKDR